MLAQSSSIKLTAAKFATGTFAMLLAFALFAGTASAQNTKTVKFGQTSVALSGGFVSALESLGVSAGTVAPTQIFNGTAYFPITGGAIDLDTAEGQIIHSGGLTLTAGKTKVSLQSFIIDTTNVGAPVLTGLVVADGALLGRVPLFNLALPSGLKLPLKPTYGFLLEIPGVGVTLTSTAASALNSVFGVTAFTGGFNIGTASVQSVLSF